MKLPAEFSMATQDDVPALNELVNGAYRGDRSKKGWTTEADLLDGIRTDEDALSAMIGKQDAVILTYRPGGVMKGCVYLEKKSGELYLGMLTVQPEQQGLGIGKKILAAAEQYARSTQCKAIFMTVITARTELIRWYEKYGYQNTGEKQPFPNDIRFGIPRQPLEFVVLRKQLTT